MRVKYDKNAEMSHFVLLTIVLALFNLFLLQDQLAKVKVVAEEGCVLLHRFVHKVGRLSFEYKSHLVFLNLLKLFIVETDGCPLFDK